jgi:HrpA-like RNA helicase
LSVEEILLKFKLISSDNTPLVELLSQMIDPPPKKNIERGILLLKQLQALDQQENVTEIGHFLSAMPVDVRVGKLLLFGILFGCLDSVLTIAAIISLGKTPFKIDGPSSNNKFSECNF